DAADALAGQGHTPYLPEPTGPGPVGTTSLWLTDTSRPDPWAAEAAARELMVSLWYPAVPSDGRRAEYMTPAESELQLTSRDITGIPPDALSTVRTNAALNATPAGPQRGLPLAVLSPGFTNPRSTLTGLAEDLASYGYAVAGIDHTYESFATAFPDGRVTTCLARQARRSGRHRRCRPRIPVPGHHPRLRPGLLRPAPAQQPPGSAGPAVTPLPRGHLLLPGLNGAATRSGPAGGRCTSR
ncbi:MAG: hypothetical protein ACRDPD_34750, partial [Streptosporangiaceae bacterium]